MRQVNGAERESYHICCTYLKMSYSEIPLNKNKNRFIGGYLSSGTMVTITCCFHLLLSQIDFGASINFNIAVNTRTVQPVVMRKGCEVNSLSCIGVLPFIEGSLGDSTSGLVAVSRDSEEHT